MSIVCVPGRPGHFLHRTIEWVDTDLGWSNARPATNDERRDSLRDWRTRRASALYHSRGNTRQRRSKRWREMRRIYGRQYARLIAEGPGSRRPQAFHVTTKVQIVEAREECRWDTVDLRGRKQG